MFRKRQVVCKWSPAFAYVIGLFASDGNLSSDGRHLSITSKDEEIVLGVKEILGLTNKIGRKARGEEKEKKYFLLQFGDINFYEFLLTLGLTPAKSRSIGSLKIPDEYFFDFLRGCIDGDGTIQAFTHPQSAHRQVRLILCSASRRFLIWIHQSIKRLSEVEGGYIYAQKNKRVMVLSFGKSDSLKILKKMYHGPGVPALKRKRIRALEYMGE